MNNCVCICSVLSDSAIPWTVACQAALSIEFSRQEYRSVLLFPVLGDLSDPGIQLTSPVSPALGGEFFTTEPPGKLQWTIICCCCCCCVTSVVSDSVRPHRWQPTTLPCPWDSPGKNTGVGCHFLLQCMKVKSEREGVQSCPTLATPWTATHQAPPSMGFSRQEYWSGVPLPSPNYMVTNWKAQKQCIYS